MQDDCREVLRDLHAYLDHECPERLESEIVRHLADCQPCLNRSDFERELRALIARHCRDVAPAGLMHRVLQQLR